MDTRKIASEYRLAQWGQMIQARVQSGQSIKEFCASVGVSRNAYFYWQRKLREAACAELTVTNILYILVTLLVSKLLIFMLVRLEQSANIYLISMISLVSSFLKSKVVTLSIP
jgi:hypothetical protein